METAKYYYNQQYESWMPWIEDKYLAWTGQNKASYTAEGLLARRLKGYFFTDPSQRTSTKPKSQATRTSMRFKTVSTRVFPGNSQRAVRLKASATW